VHTLDVVASLGQSTTTASVKEVLRRAEGDPHWVER